MINQEIIALQAAWQAVSRQALLPAVEDRLAQRSGLCLPRTARVALVHLAERGPTRVSELAAFAEVEISTMSRSLRHLDEPGFIRREPGRDLRAVHVGITPAGEQAAAQILAAGHQLLGDVLASWSESERELLAGLLARFAQDFTAYLTSGSRALAGAHQS